MTQTKLKEPSILVAGSNTKRLIRNLQYVLSKAAVKKLEAELGRNVTLLLELGDGHLSFAKSLPKKQWRQRASRFYYAAYNLKRAVTLYVEGKYSTDSSDHKAIAKLPEDFPNVNTYTTQFGALRDDRNLADYSHLSSDTDLVLTTNDAQALVSDFREDVLEYLKAKGLKL